MAKQQASVRQNRAFFQGLFSGTAALGRQNLQWLGVWQRANVCRYDALGEYTWIYKISGAGSKVLARRYFYRLTTTVDAFGDTNLPSVSLTDCTYSHPVL